MKAKRILSILLTGSMLLSLLPVSALAAAPVFDAPAQTTAKKAAPLVQEADASRSTEEEAATRSSRDLDAENGTADSITIDLNADGTPAGSGDSGHWECGNATSFNLHLQQGTFTLVRRYTISNCLNVVNVVIITAGAIIPFIAGTVIWMFFDQKPAPSSSALS